MGVNIQDQIAAVVAVYEAEIKDLMKKLSQAAIENVSAKTEIHELRGRIETVTKDNQAFVDRAIKAEACVVELEAMLPQPAPSPPDKPEPPPSIDDDLMR